jgi:hypothetical protein
MEASWRARHCITQCISTMHSSDKDEYCGKNHCLGSGVWFPRDSDYRSLILHSHDPLLSLPRT